MPLPALPRLFRPVNALSGTLIALSLAVLAHHGGEFASVLGEGVGHAKLTLDFRTYMCGAADLVHPYDICRNGEFVSGFVYPPPSIIYFHALSRLSIDTAFVIHSLVALACLAVASWMLVRMAQVRTGAALTALMAALAIAPIGTSFAAGQVNVIVMALAVAAIYLAGRSRFLGAGLAVASGFWLKLYPGIVPILFLNRAKWRAVAATCGCVALFAVLALPWAGPALYIEYFGELLPHAQKYTMPGVAFSLAGIGTHVLTGGGAPIQHFMPIPAGLGLASKVLLALGIGAALAHQHWTRDEKPLDTLALLLVAALVSAPNAWGYHYALIFPVLFTVLAQSLETRSKALPLVIACWAALVIPGWTDPPGVIAASPLLSVLFRDRYAFVALTLALVILIPAWPRRASSPRFSPAT